MFVILDKPSLTFKKPIPLQLPGKQITIYTNQLQNVSKSGIIKHMLDNNKLSAFSNKLSINNMSKEQKRRFEHVIFMRTAQQKENVVIDQLLEFDENLYQYKIQFPIILQIKVQYYEQIINSNTKSLIFDKDFTILGKIGQGSYAQIFLAREKGTQYLRAIKVIDKARCAKLGDVSFITNQAIVLKQMESPWHISLYYVFQDIKNVYFVTEYCPYGDLHMEIVKKYIQMSMYNKIVYFIQIALGICRLHKKGYIYRDLKPQNVLIDYNGNAKLCDFGYCMKYKSGELYYDICGSYQYLPPELVSKQGYNTSFDLYCLGLLFYQLLTGINPFKGITSKNLSQIKQKKIDFQISGASNATKDLIKKLMQKQPSRRIGFQDSSFIFKHQFFKENNEIVMRVLKNQKFRQRQTNEEFFTRIPFKSQNNYENQKNINKNIIVFMGKIYNYLAPEFEMKQKMGPKIAPNQLRTNRSIDQQ